MPPLRLVSSAFGEELEGGFADIRAELDVPVGFPDEVLAAVGSP